MNIRHRGYLICSTTSAMYPNYDGLSRRRTRHLFAKDQDKFDYPASLCGGLAVSFSAPSDLCRPICKQCMAIADKLEATTPKDEGK